MKEVLVALEHFEYRVLIENNILSSVDFVISKYLVSNRVFIITDNIVLNIYAEKLADVLNEKRIDTTIYAIDASEQNKNLDTVVKIYDALATGDISRNDLIIAIGGGIVGDIAGFVASTWMRGVSYIQIPTTLLACVDSSVGGKTGVNTKFGKNLIGSFYHPTAVIIDPLTLNTLSNQFFNAGFAEIVKHALLFDKALFEFIESHSSRLELMNSIEYIIERNCQLKADIVMRDSREKGERMLLNFGHTLAHAIETASNYAKYLHGEAVSIGMVFAVRYGIHLGITNADLLERIEVMLDKLCLPIKIPPHLNICKFIKQDKKCNFNKLKFIFLKDIEVPCIIETDLNNLLLYLSSQN